MTWYKPSDVGFQTRKTLANWGHGARLLWRLTVLGGSSFRRFGLIRDQIHFLGNYSLAIITVSLSSQRVPTVEPTLLIEVISRPLVR